MLEEWKWIIRVFAKNMSGPILANEVWLDLIAKKAAGFRTVATFSSFWTAAKSTAVKNRSTAKHMRKTMEAAIARSKGQEHSLIL